MSGQETLDDLSFLAEISAPKNELTSERIPNPPTIGPAKKIKIELGRAEKILPGCGELKEEDLQEKKEYYIPTVEELTKNLIPSDRTYITRIIRENVDKLPEFEIQKIFISLYDSDTIDRETNIEINSPEENGLNTVNDPRLGTQSYSAECSTCHRDYSSCPGHFGKIKLARKIINPLLLSHAIKILSCVCNSCGGLLLTEDVIIEKGIDKYFGETRLKMIRDASLKLPCLKREKKIENITMPGIEMGEIESCQSNPIYKPKQSKKEDRVLYKWDDKDPSSKYFERTPDEIEEIFRNISQEDARLLGYNDNGHPSSIIMTNLLVLPPCVRIPNIRDGIVMPDMISEAYISIIKKNNELKLEGTLSVQDEIFKSLKFYIRHLIDNTDGRYVLGRSKTAGKTFKSIKERINGKKEMIRSHLMSKRVNFSARSVIGPDPSLKFYQVRLPEYMKKYLTRPEVVTNYNKNSLMELLKKKEITHITFGPLNKKLKNARIVADTFKGELQVGDTVDRWARDGDYVIANRQPTLHARGMMGHEAVFMKTLSIGFPLAPSTSYNYDFDGRHYIYIVKK